jgi:hypothetical protein
VSEAFDERLAKTRGNADERAAALERARAEREDYAREERAAAMAASRALLPELRSAIDALRAFEEADPARTSQWKLESRNVDLGWFPDSAPITLTREYRPARGLGRGSRLEGWTIRAARGGLTIRISRSAREPLVTEPFDTLEAAADAGIYSLAGRVVVTSEAFEAVIQMIADHIARGH